MDLPLACAPTTNVRNSPSLTRRCSSCIRWFSKGKAEKPLLTGPTKAAGDGLAPLSICLSLLSVMAYIFRATVWSCYNAIQSLPTIDLPSRPINRPNTTALILSKQISCHYAQMFKQLGINLYYVLFRVVNNYCTSMRDEQMNGWCQIVGRLVSTINQKLEIAIVAA